MHFFKVTIRAEAKSGDSDFDIMCSDDGAIQKVSRDIDSYSIYGYPDIDSLIYRDVEFDICSTTKVEVEIIYKI